MKRPNILLILFCLFAAYRFYQEIVQRDYFRSMFFLIGFVLIAHSLIFYKPIINHGTKSNEIEKE
jgi:hypothetical protein